MDLAPEPGLVEGVRREDHTVMTPQGPRKVLVYRPEAEREPLPSMLWIHGGGLIMGAPEQNQLLSARIAKAAKCVVCVPSYRLAPEHPFPAGLEDCYAALSWMHNSASDLGIDRSRIAIGGDSAGGGLAACVAQMALDTGGPTLCFACLLYPMLDDRTPLHSDRQAIFWTAQSNRFAWEAYLGHPGTIDDSRPYASASRRNDLAGLPSTWIGVGDQDLFYLESMEFAQRLTKAGVPCRFEVIEGMYHAAERFKPNAPRMLALVDNMLDSISNALHHQKPA